MHPEVKTPEYVVELARDMRNNLTDSENTLWNVLKNRQINGYKFRCQHPIYRYILDFYCHERSLAVEVDGKSHENNAGYDEYRDKLLESLAIRTIRFKNTDVMNNMDGVIKKIRDELTKDK